MPAIAAVFALIAHLPPQLHPPTCNFRQAYQIFDPFTSLDSEGHIDKSMTGTAATAATTVIVVTAVLTVVAALVAALLTIPLSPHMPLVVSATVFRAPLTLSRLTRAVAVGRAPPLPPLR